MSDQYVRVPRELLEKALKADASQGASAMDLHHGWLAMKVLRSAIAAPAEDVRAVGEDMVRPGGVVDVIFRDGVKSYDCPAECWEWIHMRSATDIVKWRPAQ